MSAEPLRRLRRVRSTAKWIAANDVLLASLALSVLILIFFYDVVFLERTLVTSPFAFERLGVTGTSPPFGYPSDPPDYNIYLMDPLPSAWSSETSAVAIVIPADGPSLGIAPSGTCTWISHLR